MTLSRKAINRILFSGFVAGSILIAAAVSHARQSTGFLGMKLPEFKNAQTDPVPKPDFRFLNNLNVKMDARLQFSGNETIKEQALEKMGQLSARSLSFTAHGREYKTLMLERRISMAESEDSDIKPYLSFGAGIAKHEGSVLDTNLETRNAEKSGSGFAMQFGGGFAMPLSQDVMFNSDYRYFESSRFDTVSGPRGYDDHRIMFGLTFELD